MVAFAPLWPRKAPPDDRVAEVVLVCFSEGPLREDVPFRVDLFGLPSKESMSLADIRMHRRDDAPEWFDGWRNEAAGRVAEEQLGASFDELRAATVCHTVALSVASPVDHGYLQAAWAVARWMVARGATVVLDAHAGTFLDAERLAARPVGAPLNVRREISIVFETDSSEASGDHVYHTRGMRKFGRPDLVALASPDDRDAVANLLGQLAEAIGDGPLPVLPRHGVDMTATVTLFIVDDIGDAFAQRLGLNNDARLIVDANGGSLRGLAARLR